MILLHLLKICSALIFFMMSADQNIQDQTIMAVQAQTYTKMPLLVGYICKVTNTERMLDLETLKKDLEFSNQFKVDIRILKKTPSKKEMQQLAQQGYPLGIFIQDHKKHLDWHLYDMHALVLQEGRRYKKNTTLARAWSHQVADNIWPIVTGLPGIFSTKIAYCKEATKKNGITFKQICIADYDGSHEQVIVDKPTVMLMPGWNSNAKKPSLSYSEHTNKNVRLVMVDMHKKRHVAIDKDGINMELIFAPDGSMAIYCASDKDGYSQLYMYKNNTLEQLTHYKGNTLSPTIGADDTIYFCSDFKTNSPQIFSYNVVTHELQQITQGGYCASPNYCAHTNKLVYTRKVQGVMQLFTYDVATKKHTQLTHDAAQKHECAWSVCGTYIISCIENKATQRLALINTISGDRTFVTSAQVRCSDPAWSGYYQEFPVVMS